MDDAWAYLRGVRVRRLGRLADLHAPEHLVLDDEAANHGGGLHAQLFSHDTLHDLFTVGWE